MTFEQALLHADYIYDPQAGSYMKEDANGDLHTYMHLENNEWNYEKYDADDNVIASVPFTVPFALN